MGLKTLLALSFIALLLLSSVALALGQQAEALSPLSFTSGSTFSSLNSGRWQHVWDDDSNHAIVFNATLQQYLRAANNTVHDVGTEDFWTAGMIYRTRDSGTDEIIVQKKGSFLTATAGYVLFITGGQDKLNLRISDGTNQNERSTTVSISTDVWYAWGFSADRDGNMQLFLYNLDTGYIETQTLAMTASGSATNTQTFTAARNSASSANFFPGYMDNLIPPQIGQTLTQEQFLEFATTGKISGITPTSFYGFNEGAAGAIVLDRFGINNLTPFNSPTYTTDVPSSSLPENMTYFVDTNQGSFKAVRYDRIYHVSDDVTATLSSSSNPSASSPIEKAGGVVRVYTAQQMSTTALEVNIVNLWTGGIIRSANITLSATNAISGSPIAVASTKNAVYYVVQGTLDVTRLGFYRSNRDLTNPTAIDASVAAGAQDYLVRMEVAVNGAALADDVLYVIKGSATAGPNQTPRAFKVTSAAVSNIGNIGATTTTVTALSLANVADKMIATITQSGTMSTYTITKSSDAISSAAFTETWITHSQQPYDFDGTTLTYKDKAYYATADRSISYDGATGTLTPYDTLFVESVNNVTGTLTGIDSTFYRISDSLVVTGSGTTWTPRSFESVSIAPVPYSERLDVALVRNNTLFGDNVFRLVCDAPYEWPEASEILVDNDDDCVSWKVLATDGASVGRVLLYEDDSDLIHANPLTAYTFHAFASTPTDISVTIKYGGKDVDRNIFDDGTNSQVRLLYGQCYTTTYHRISTNEELSSGSFCAGDVTTVNVIISRTLGFPFWSAPWGVFHEYNETSNILDVTVRHKPFPYDYTIKIFNSNGTELVNDALNSAQEVDIQTYNLTSYVAGAPLKLEVYSDEGKRVYQYYLDSRPLYLSSIAALFDGFEFAGFNILWFIPLVFMGLWSRNTASVGIMLSVAVIAVFNWLGILDLPDPVVWLLVIGGVIGMLASRRLFE